MVSTSYGTRALSEPVRAKHFPSNRTDELLAGAISRAAEQTT
jgi:hypothetical protein